MTKDCYSIILVPSTTHAMRAEKVLKEAKLACKLIPVPRQIRSDCGVCIRIARSDRENTLQALRGAKLELEGVHDL